MSKICRTFAARKDTIMEKRTYIQPKCEAMILPKEALMDDLILAGSGSMSTVGKTLAPAIGKHRTPVF